MSLPNGELSAKASASFYEFSGMLTDRITVPHPTAGTRHKGFLGMEKYPRGEQEGTAWACPLSWTIIGRRQVVVFDSPGKPVPFVQSSPLFGGELRL